MKIKLIFFLAILLFPLMPTGVRAQETQCQSKINFDAISPTGKSLFSNPEAVPYDLEITLKAKVSLSNCGAGIYDVGFLQIYSTGFKSVPQGDQKLRFDTMYSDGRWVEKEFQVKVKPGYLYNYSEASQLAGDGDKVQVQAWMQLGDVLLKSSPLTVNVGKSTKATPPPPPQTGGQGNVNPGNGAKSSAEPISFSGGLTNPIKYNSVGGFISGVIAFLLALIGGLSVLFIIIGGVQMISSAGNADQLTKGKKTLTWAVVGLLVALLGYAIINVVQSIV